MGKNLETAADVAVLAFAIFVLAVCIAALS